MNSKQKENQIIVQKKYKYQGVHLNNISIYETQIQIQNTNKNTKYKIHTNTKEIKIQKKNKYQGVHPPVLSRPTPSLHSKVQPDCE